MVASVQTRNAEVLALVLLATIPLGWRAVASVAIGGSIQMVNLRLLERSVSGLIQDADPARSRAFRALLALRLVLMLGMVGAVLLLSPVEPLAFTLGLSTVVPAVIWHGLRTARQRA